MAEVDKKKLALLEAILFTTHEPLTEEKIAKNLGTKSIEKVRELLNAIREKYDNPEHGIKLSDMGGYRLVVKHEFVGNVSHLTPHSDLSRGVLRVLSIIAFHEPVEQSEIVKIVGNRTYEYIHELLERGLIKSEKKGRTRILGTTPHFEEYFNVNTEELKKELKKRMDKKDMENDERKNDNKNERQKDDDKKEEQKQEKQDENQQEEKEYEEENKDEPYIE